MKPLKLHIPNYPYLNASDNPDLDKEVGDSKNIFAGIVDFKNAHPSLSYSTFIGDSSFDYPMFHRFLLSDHGFLCAVIPNEFP